MEGRGFLVPIEDGGEGMWGGNINVGFKIRDMRIILVAKWPLVVLEVTSDRFAFAVTQIFGEFSCIGRKFGIDLQEKHFNGIRKKGVNSVND